MRLKCACRLGSTVDGEDKVANIGSSIGSARTRVPWLLIWALSVVLLGTVGVEGAAAQATGTVRGTVVASATGEPIQGVSITASGTTVGTITDPRGRYTLDLPAGRFELRASRVGYRAETQSVTIS